MEEKIDSIIIKLAETDEELCGRGYVHCTALMAAKSNGILAHRFQLSE